MASNSKGTKSVRSKKPNCVGGQACGMTCISMKLTCSERLRSPEASKLGQELTKLVGGLSSTKPTEVITSDDSIPRYKAVKKLGQGVFGSAYLTDRDTIVKVPIDKTNDTSEQELEYNHLKIAGNKLGIMPRALAFDPATGKIEMEQAPGKTIEDLMKGDDDEAILNAVQSAMEGLGKLHEAGYTHGDLHIGNVMYDESSGKSLMIDAGSMRANNSPAGASPAFDYETLGSLLALKGSGKDQVIDQSVDNLRFRATVALNYYTDKFNSDPDVIDISATREDAWALKGPERDQVYTDFGIAMAAKWREFHAKNPPDLRKLMDEAFDSGWYEENS